jgi:hypothetical protein
MEWIRVTGAPTMITPGPAPNLVDTPATLIHFSGRRMAQIRR